jgi:hypothetical protein
MLGINMDTCMTSDLNSFLALAVELQRHADVAGACGAGVLNK